MASGVFYSKWGQQCKGCGDFIKKGDLIRFNDDDQIIGEYCCGQDQYEYWEASNYESSRAAVRQARRYSRKSRSQPNVERILGEKWRGA